jgi:hypothetical protein
MSGSGAGIFMDSITALPPDMTVYVSVVFVPSSAVPPLARKGQQLLPSHLTAASDRRHECADNHQEREPGDHFPQSDQNETNSGLRLHREPV